MLVATRQKTDFQIIKKRRFEREFSWIKKEFADFNILTDVELYNTERFVQLHLNVHFI